VLSQNRKHIPTQYTSAGPAYLFPDAEEKSAVATRIISLIPAQPPGATWRIDDAGPLALLRLCAQPTTPRTEAQVGRRRCTPDSDGARIGSLSVRSAAARLLS